MKKIITLSLLLMLFLFNQSLHVKASETYPGENAIFTGCEFQYLGWVNQFVIVCTASESIVTHMADNGFHLYIPYSEHLALESNNVRAGIWINEFYDIDLSNSYPNNFGEWAEVNWDQVSDEEYVTNIQLSIPFIGPASARTTQFLEQFAATLKYAPLTAPGEINLDDYARVYKEDGIWYGVIAVENIWPTGYNCSNGKCLESFFFINFTRDTSRLTELTYKYTVRRTCNWVNIFGLCVGGWDEEETFTETAYDRKRYGFFASFLLNTQSITKLNENIHDWQYQVNPNTDREIKSVEYVHMKYILTNAEIDAIREDIQHYYDLQLQAILLDPTTTIAQKEALIEALNAEYAEYTIEYGEEIESICEDPERCVYDSDDWELDEDSIPPWLDDFMGGFSNRLTEYFKTVFIAVIATVIFAATGLAILTTLAESTGNLIRKAILRWLKTIGIVAGFYFYQGRKAAKYFINTVLSVFNIHL